jgi:predicted DNA-binding transcriptional regulator AlpA
VKWTLPSLDDIRQWPATVSVPTACSALGIGKSCGYDAARRGNFPARVIKVGGRYRVVTASLVQVLGGE